MEEGGGEEGGFRVCVLFGVSQAVMVAKVVPVVSKAVKTTKVALGIGSGKGSC